MDRGEILEIIRSNLETAGLQDADIRIQPDLLSGWRIAVISDEFKDMSMAERRGTALKGLEKIDIEWDEFLTHQEMEWVGDPFADSGMETLPLWPEALERGQRDSGEMHFPSELDEDLELPICASFYSLRGGVGRSTALAYTGRILSAKGRKVVCVDMDLEAPGLASLFGCEQRVEANQGVADLLVQIDQGETPDITGHLIKVADDDLYCLPAGIASANYARLLRFIDPVAWYREEKNPLRSLIEMIETRLPFKPDAILLDSRTGITPLSGPLLFDLADISIITFFPHPQAKAGTQALVKALLRSKTRRKLNHLQLTPEPRFLVSPIPSSQIKEITDRYRNRALEWIEEWLQPLAETDMLLDEMDITHFITYKEALATSDDIFSDNKLWAEYEPIVQWIERFLPTQSEKAIEMSIGNLKSRILEELHFSTGTAERQDDFIETFVETEVVRKAIDQTNPLVIGRKGTGKTAIFRWMMEESSDSIVIHAPTPLDKGKTWILSPDAFQAIGEQIDKGGGNWRQFWAFYICVALYLQKAHHVPPPADFRQDFSLNNKSETKLVHAFGTLLKMDQLGLRLNDWLSDIDEGLKQKMTILFDGLDVGFGSSEPDRKRRNTAISGLFDFWMNRESKLSNIAFKIFLREDLWKSIIFENKSHLYGRSVTLKWTERVTYYRVAIKQAIRSETFKTALKALGDGAKTLDPRFENWPDVDVQQAWNLLVGERMKGGKTAFTRNWVWSRLADGKNDHSPRYLLQLFNRIVEWEKNEHQRSPYERSIIRARAMEKCLPDVSQEALDALSEEFRDELAETINHIKNQIDRTPMPASAFKSLGSQNLSTAVEVGLLSVYEGTAENVERYKVPDLFRHALKLTRKGQF